MAGYCITAPAEQDVLDIWLYIARDNIHAADRLVDRFTETFERLAENPHMGESVERYRPGLRCFSLGNYVVYYRMADKGIEVYRVLHGARRAEDHL